MQNPFKLIHRFNDEAGFLAKGCNPWLEAAYQIEEAIEGYDLDEMAIRLLGGTHLGLTSKELARAILGERNQDVEIPSVDLLDKSLDAIVFAVGAIYKLGLSPNDLTKALNIVMQANLQKLKAPKYDAEGKLLKDNDFKGPELELQKLLDEVRAK